MNEAKARYEEDGFYLAREPLFPSEMIGRAVEGMDAIRRGEYDTGRGPESSPWNPGDDPNKLCKIEQPQFASQAVMDLLRHPALGEKAAEITAASRVQAWWVQLLYKPSDRGNPDDRTHIGWHQDRQYWGIWEEGSELFTAWIALSDVGEECGPMKFLRGSHKWGLRDGGDFFRQDLEGQRGAILPEGSEADEAAAILPPGGVSFHHCMTVHGSGPNRSGRPRRSFAVHLRTEKSRPVGDRREGLSRYIDRTDLCPVIYGE